MTTIERQKAKEKQNNKNLEMQKEYLFEGWLKKTAMLIKIAKDIKNMILQRIPINLLIDSIILSKIEKKYLYQCIEKELPDFKNCEINLIQRASKHGYQPSFFHKYCDFKENTIVIVETGYGNICGGFVCQPWQTRNYTEHNKWAIKDNTAFMFVLKLGDISLKFKYKNKKKLPHIYKPNKTCHSCVVHYVNTAWNFGFNDFYIQQCLPNIVMGACYSNQGNYEWKYAEQITGDNHLNVLTMKCFN